MLLYAAASAVPGNEAAQRKKCCPQLEIDCTLCHTESQGKFKLSFVKQTKNPCMCISGVPVRAK